MPQPKDVDVVALIDRERFGWYQIRIVSACAVIAMLDGFDTQAAAFVAPVIAAEWDLSISAFGPIFGAVLLGLMIGALVLGPAADRVGRKPITIISLALFGIFALLTVTATSLNELLLLRFLTGLGLGGAMPNIIAITSEYTPVRLRSTMISAMFCGFPLGAVLGGLLAAKMIPMFGWQSVFLLGGIAPLLIIPILLLILPESVRLMVARGDRSVQIARVLNRIAPASNISADSQFSLPEQKVTGFTVAKLFSDGRTSKTLLLWTTFFMNLLMLYFLASWLPSVLNQAGVPLERAILSTALLNFGGIAGALILARIADRTGPYRVLIAGYIGAAICTWAVGTLGYSFGALMTAVSLAGFFVIGTQINMNALAAATYPTAIRSTGVGWALGIGRIGSVVGPVVGGILLSTGMGVTHLFTVAAIPALVAAVAVLALSRLRDHGVETQRPRLVTPEGVQ